MATIKDTSPTLRWFVAFVSPNDLSHPQFLTGQDLRGEGGKLGSCPTASTTNGLPQKLKNSKKNIT